MVAAAVAVTVAMGATAEAAAVEAVTTSAAVVVAVAAAVDHHTTSNVVVGTRTPAPSTWPRSLAPRRTRSTARSTLKLAPVTMVTSARVCTIGRLIGTFTLKKNILKNN